MIHVQEDREPTLLVIGGGIAGASVAYFAARSGWAVTLLDAAEARASDVPAALLDPARGQSGRMDVRALEGLRLSWSLIRRLEARGHRIPHEHNGVLRPLASDLARAKFERHLPPELPHHWLTAARSPAPLAPGWPHLLLLPEGGWLAGAALVTALIAASRATVRRGRVATWDAHTATLAGGEVLSAEAVVWCGGSIGATWGGGTGLPTSGQTHRGGTLLLLDRAVTPLPVSSGVYLSPIIQENGQRGGVLGATFEAPAPQCNVGGPALRSLNWLLSRASALTGNLSSTVTGFWSGSRLSGERFGQQPGGWWALSGLGSKGFLLGPLLARELVAELSGHSSGPSGSPRPSSPDG